METIFSYLQPYMTFGPNDLALMGQALELATCKDPSADPNILAKAIMAFACTGERQLENLCSAALRAHDNRRRWIASEMPWPQVV